MNKQQLKQAYLSSTTKEDRFILRREQFMQDLSGKGNISTSNCYYKIYLKKDLHQIIVYFFTSKAEVKKGEVECESLYTVSKILEAKTELNAYYKYLDFVKSLTPELEDKYLAEFYLIKANSIIWVKKMIRKQRRYICKLKKKHVLD